MTPTVLITTELLIDRPVLSMELVGATGSVMARRFGDEPGEWEKSYRHVLEDWDNYWADLNLAEDNSLGQWREGRWRVERALFRLTHKRPPSEEKIALHLDKLPREIGRECDAWLPGAVDGLRALAARGAKIVLIAPTQSSALIWGLLDSARLSKQIDRVLGPDELGQVGLDDDAPEWLLRQAGGPPAETWLISTQLGEPALRPPPDLSHLPDLVFHQEAGGSSSHS